MTSRFPFMATAVLALSSSTMANFLGRRDSISCPAFCLTTTTVTMVSTTTVTSTTSVTNYGRPRTELVVVHTSTPEISSNHVQPSYVYSTPSIPVQPSPGYIMASSPIQPPQVDSRASRPVQPSPVDNTATNSGQATSIPTRTPNNCDHNNCLRQFLRHPQVTAFCATYTTTLNTATTNLPNYVSQCHADPSRISSACSCVVPGGVKPTSPTQSNTTPGRGNSRSPSIVPTTSTRHHQHHSRSTVTMPTGSGNGLCTASMITETYTETTTSLVTIIGSPSSFGGANSGEVLISANTFIPAASSSMA